MKRWCLFLVFMLLFTAGTHFSSSAQCSICSRSVQQMGQRPAKALNTGILYLAAAPLLIAGFIGYRWWKSGK